MSKGSKQRPTDLKKYIKNYELIFTSKDDKDGVSPSVSITTSTGSTAEPESRT